jgi:hypothetical protein
MLLSWKQVSPHSLHGPMAATHFIANFDRIVSEYSVPIFVKEAGQ